MRTDGRPTARFCAAWFWTCSPAGRRQRRRADGPGRSAFGSIRSSIALSPSRSSLWARSPSPMLYGRSRTSRASNCLAGIRLSWSPPTLSRMSGSSFSFSISAIPIWLRFGPRRAAPRSSQFAKRLRTQRPAPSLTRSTRKRCSRYSLKSAWEARRSAYLKTVVEKFSNPFLNHRLSEIFINHEAKKRQRFGGLIDLAKANDCGVDPAAPQGRSC